MMINQLEVKQLYHKFYTLVKRIVRLEFADPEENVSSPNLILVDSSSR